jgi:hypothetical protein
VSLQDTIAADLHFKTIKRILHIFHSDDVIKPLPIVGANYDQINTTSMKHQYFELVGEPDTLNQRVYHCTKEMSSQETNSATKP